MALRLSLVCLILLPLAVASRWGDYPVEQAHGRVFAALPWTPQELETLSDLHARAEYHELMAFVKAKLLANRDIDPSAIRRIERFLLTHRPPHALKNLFTSTEKDEILELKNESEVAEDPDQNIEDILSIWKRALSRVGEHASAAIMTYIASNSAPPQEQ